MKFDLSRAHRRLATVAVILAAGAAWPARAQTTHELAFHTNDAEIFLIHADGSERTLLTDGFSPAWSPQGERLVFSRDAESPDLYVIFADGSHPVRLTEGLNAHHPAWSPDGQHLAFTGELGEPDGSHARLFIAPAPAPVPDPAPLAPRRLLAPGGFAHDRRPAWSPTGQHLAFVGDTLVNGRTVSNIYVAQLDDAQQVLALWPVTHLREPLQNTPLAWSRDGSALYFAHRNDLWTVDASGALEPTRTVAEAGDTEREPALSADGAHFVYLRADSSEDPAYVGLSVRPVQGRVSRDLHTGLAFAPAWNPAPASRADAQR